MKKMHSSFWAIRAMAAVMALIVTLSAQLAFAISEMAEADMADVNGAGIALALDNYSFRMAPTSYIEMTGSAMAGTVGPGINAATVAAYNLGWRQGDLRYYGMSFTGAGAGTDWFGNGCTAGADGLGCPVGTTVIKDFSSIYNPYLIRVFQYAGYDYQGTCQGTVAAGACSTITAASPTAYEFIAPSKSDAWRWAFWGQLRIDNNNASANLLKSQSIILGKNSTTDGKPTKIQILQTPTNVASEQSLSLVYQSRLSGNFRFSVQQAAGSDDSVNKVPDFNDNEGLYFKNVDAFMPLGQLNYQTVVFRASGTTGNFVLDLTAIPNTAAVYNSFYCKTNTCTTTTFQGGKAGSTGAILTSDVVIAAPNADTHGYVRWGTTTGAAPVENSTDTTNGIYFRDGAGTAANIGRAKIDGLLIQSMQITSLSAGS